MSERLHESPDPHMETNTWWQVSFKLNEKNATNLWKQTLRDRPQGNAVI